MSICIFAQSESNTMLHTILHTILKNRMLGKIRCDDGGSDNEDVALQSDTQGQCNAKVLVELLDHDGVEKDDEVPLSSSSSSTSSSPKRSSPSSSPPSESGES